MKSYKEKLLSTNDGSFTPIPPYIGKAILVICTNLAKKSNFSGYTEQYKQEMISDACLDCVCAVDKFDTNRFFNPHAYFSKIAWNAFIRRITSEKKQTYIKHKNYVNEYVVYGHADGDLLNQKVGDISNDIIQSFEDKQDKKQLTNAKKNGKISSDIGLEKFVKE
jgi:hypothetical protein